MASLLPKRLVLAAVLIFWGVRCERLGQGGDGDEGAGATWGNVRGQGRLSTRALVLALLVSPAIGQAQAADNKRQARVAQAFRRLDLNQDGLLSRDEFQQMLPQSPVNTQAMSLESLFFQADIDDDDQLSLEEFEFARFLGNERYIAEDYLHLEPHLPAGFMKDFDEAFDDLAQGSGAKVTLKDILSCTRRLLRLPAEEGLGRRLTQTLRSYFKQADIIPDDVLNMNEFDYFRFLARDGMIRAALQQEALEPQKESGVMEESVREFLRGYDVDGDGKLNEEELVMGLMDVFTSMVDVFDGPMTERGEEYARNARAHFASADADGDGFLDLEESAKLIGRLMVIEQGQT